MTLKQTGRTARYKAFASKATRALDIDRGVFELKLSESQGLNIIADLSRRESFDTDFGLTAKNKNGKSFEGAINGGGPRFSIQADRSRISLKRE